MRRTQVIGMVVGVLTALAVTTGCARPTTPGAAAAAGQSASKAPAGQSASEAPAGRPASKAPAADIYVQVLRRYLGPPWENSFPEQTFPIVYVLDQAFPDTADPSGKHTDGVPIAVDAQRQITAALAGTARIAFVADRSTVIETKDGCAQVKDGGMLITLGPPEGDDRQVNVAVYGFVACLGATWLTYVVQHQPTGDWQVTGTTGPMAIS